MKQEEIATDDEYYSESVLISSLYLYNLSTGKMSNFLNRSLEWYPKGLR